MPLPTKNPGESQTEFMTRCVNDPVMTGEYKTKSQRIAICYNQSQEK